jgi:dTDP-4-amino-4,6-dideoxygalactose transaminase
VLRVKLPYLDKWNQARLEVASFYHEQLKPLSHQLISPKILPDRIHVFHQYTVRLCAETLSREDLIQALANQGIQTMIYYPVPLYRQKTHDFLELNPADFPNCETVCRQVLSLPMFPELTSEEQTLIVKTLDTVLNPAVLALS